MSIHHFTVPRDEKRIHYEVVIIADTKIQSQEGTLLIVKERLKNTLGLPRKRKGRRYYISVPMRI